MQKKSSEKTNTDESSHCVSRLLSSDTMACCRCLFFFFLTLHPSWWFSPVIIDVTLLVILISAGKTEHVVCSLFSINLLFLLIHLVFVNFLCRHPHFSAYWTPLGFFYCRYYLAILTVLIFHPSASVDRNNFKTCDQSGFCKWVHILLNGKDNRISPIKEIICFVISRRQRAYAPESTPYHVDVNSLKVSDQSVEFYIKNTQNNIGE